MAKKQAPIPISLRPWIEARQRFRLSHAHVQMARELGLNPKKFGKLANHHQEPWKRPLPDFIAALYVKRFGKPIPAVVKTIEEIAAAALAKKRAKKTSSMPSSQRERIRPRSNSAMPPMIVSINLPAAVVVSHQVSPSDKKPQDRSCNS